MWAVRVLGDTGWSNWVKIHESTVRMLLARTTSDVVGTMFELKRSGTEWQSGHWWFKYIRASEPIQVTECC
jgi:hypothetical protein